MDEGKKTLTFEYRHEPVLLAEVLEALDPVLEGYTKRLTSAKAKHLARLTGPVICDCTLGGAGHSLRFADKLLAYNSRLVDTLGTQLGCGADKIPKALVEPYIYQPQLEPYTLYAQQASARLIGIDQDDLALETAARRLDERSAQEACGLVHRQLKGNFSELDRLLSAAACPGVDFFLFDIGVSSPQFDIPERGFSYRCDAPLDMRMDPASNPLTAQEIIASYEEHELIRIFREYGEEKYAARLARILVKRRESDPVGTTFQLVEAIKEAIPAAARRSGGHPAKRAFQALRIEVNKELEVLELGVEAALRWLRPGGRLAVISYHSLEDRLVKRMFAQYAQGCVCPPDMPVCNCGKTAYAKVITKKPVVALAEELERNPRSASAKMRVSQKL